MSSSDHYWFRAKRYGWGWGLPVAWQGWVVLMLYAAALALLARFVPPAVAPMGFLAGAFFATVLLVLVCWLKGEPPRWRWGDK